MNNYNFPWYEETMDKLSNLMKNGKSIIESRRGNQQCSECKEWVSFRIHGKCQKCTKLELAGRTE